MCNFQICGSLYTNLTLAIKNCLKALGKSQVEKNWKLSVTIISVQNRRDDYNCGLFAIAFTTDVLKELSPVDTWFDVSLMRSHRNREFNPLSANPKKRPNTLKQFVNKLPANCLSVLSNFVNLALIGLMSSRKPQNAFGQQKPQAKR